MHLSPTSKLGYLSFKARRDSKVDHLRSVKEWTGV